jgi:hypothetical protein
MVTVPSDLKLALLSVVFSPSAGFSAFTLQFPISISGVAAPTLSAPVYAVRLGLLMEAHPVLRIIAIEITNTLVILYIIIFLFVWYL